MAELTSEQLVHLLDNSEKIVSALSGHDLVDLFQKMLKKSIVGDRKKTLFYSLDHAKLDPELLARYLLRLVSERIRESTTVWKKFLNFLNQIGEKEISEKLKKMSALTEDHIAHCAKDEDAVILSCDDVSLLVNLMASVTHKYDKIGLALNLPMYKIEQCEGTSLAMKLGQILTCWISEDKHTPPSTTLSKLKNALKGELVAEYQLAIDLEKKFIKTRQGEHHSPATEQSDSNPLFEILEQSIDMEVEDGKSTLLYVLASLRESVCYQWHKNGQPLTNNSTYSGVDEDILVISLAVQGTEGEYTCCVSLQDKQIISNEINLKVIYSQEKKRLLDLYSVQSEVPADSWPPVHAKLFVKLVLIKSEEQHTGLENYCIAGDADKAAVMKESVKYEDVFREYESGSLIVIEGRPGSGKTTLVHKLVKDWSNGTILRNAKLVFIVSLRSLNNTKIRCQPIYEHLEYFIKTDRDNGEKACIVLDGLDEFKSNNEPSVIYSLLNKVILPKAMVIISSRPAAVNNIRQDVITKRIQIFGFSKEQIVEYINVYPFISGSSKSQINKSYSSALEKYLHNHPNVFHMCYLPVHAAMICYLYKHKGDNIPNTQTKIYEEFTLSMILRHLKRHSNETKLTSLTELSGDYTKQFDTLCKIAFTMSTKHVQVITKDELNDLSSYDVSSGDTWCLGLLTVHHSFKCHGEYDDYTFLHLTFQEFLTAFYIASLTKEEQLEVIKCSSKLSSGVFNFFCGLLNFQDNYELLFAILKCISKDLTAYFSCAFESQQKIVCDAVVREFGGKLKFPQEITLFDIACVNFVTSNTSEAITSLDLPRNNTISLLQNIDEKHFGRIKKLELNEYFSNTSDLMVISNILKQCTQIEEIIDLWFTNISYVGSRYISKVFVNLNLRFLRMFCTSSSDSILLLLTGLKHHSNLQLDLKFEEFCSKGVQSLVKGLNMLSNNHLCNLVLSRCEITVDGAFGLTGALQNYHSITGLKLYCNNVDPVCNSAITSVLPNLTCLSSLNMSHQQAGNDEISNLASVLIYLPLLEILNLSHNNIGPVGVAAICNEFHNIVLLKSIDLSHNNIGSIGAAVFAFGIYNSSDRMYLEAIRTSSKARDLSSDDIDNKGKTSSPPTLSQHSNLQVINLSHNNIGDDGAAAIGDQLHLLLKLEYLTLSHNNIGPSCARRFAKGLGHLSLLKIIDLSDNNIGSDGANAIAAELYHLNKLHCLFVSGSDKTKKLTGITFYPCGCCRQDILCPTSFEGKKA